MSDDLPTTVLKLPLADTQPQVLELVAAVEAQDSGLFDMAYQAWGQSVTKRNKLWSRMAGDVEVWPDDWWNVGKAYQPQDTAGLVEVIEAKEAELDEMLGGFFRLSPALQDRANAKMEAIQAEIEALRGEVEDLRAPWADAEREVYQRQEAWAYVAEMANEDGPRKAEALRGVVDRIVCHFRYTKAKSFLDSVEYYPVSGDATCLTAGAKQGRDSQSNDAGSLWRHLFQVYESAVIQPILGGSTNGTA